MHPMTAGNRPLAGKGAHIAMHFGGKLTLQRLVKVNQSDYDIRNSWHLVGPRHQKKGGKREVVGCGEAAAAAVDR